MGAPGIPEGVSGLVRDISGALLDSSRISGVLPCVGWSWWFNSWIRCSRRSRLEAHSILMSSGAVASSSERVEISGSACKPLNRLRGTRDNIAETFISVRSEVDRVLRGNDVSENGASNRRTRS